MRFALTTVLIITEKLQSDKSALSAGTNTGPSYVSLSVLIGELETDLSTNTSGETPISGVGFAGSTGKETTLSGKQGRPCFFWCSGNLEFKAASIIIIYPMSQRLLCFLDPNTDIGDVVRLFLFFSVTVLHSQLNPGTEFQQPSCGRGWEADHYTCVEASNIP